MAEAKDNLNVVRSANIVSAFFISNKIPVSNVGSLIVEVYASLVGLSAEIAKVLEPTKRPVPAVPVKKSVSGDFIICLEDGKKFKTLKRHLRVSYGLSPDAYREKWSLPADYPMVAPGYADIRSELAKKFGFGLKTVKAKRAPSGIVSKSKATRK